MCGSHFSNIAGIGGPAVAASLTNSASRINMGQIVRRVDSERSRQMNAVGGSLRLCIVVILTLSLLIFVTYNLYIDTVETLFCFSPPFRVILHDQIVF